MHTLFSVSTDVSSKGPSVSGLHYLTTTWVLNQDLSHDEYSRTKVDITNSLQNAGLIVSDNKHSLEVCGYFKDLQKVVNTTLEHQYEEDGHEYITPVTDVQIPKEWKDGVVHILGLHTRRLSRAFNYVLSPKAVSGTFNALELARLYNFPSADGTGQKVGIISLGGGFVMADLIVYMRNLGLIDNSVTSLSNVVPISVDGATNNPNDGSGANVENVLDIEVILAVVPKATINFYSAQNSDSSFYNAINRAVQDGCKVISISWGLYESGWTSSSKNAFNSLFQTATNNGVTILCAAGDNGSSDGTSGLNVDFPGSSPFAVSCGGTRLVVSNDRQTIVSETVWNNNSTSSATGGGVSNFFNKPAYQTALVSGTKRAVPDVSANADPNTGYYLIYQGSPIYVGGTSAVAPLLSGLICRINQLRSANTGLLQTSIYAANPSVCRDITSGSNGAYSASLGFDNCSGLGVLDGTKLLSLLNGTNTPAPSQPVGIPPPVANFSSSVSSGVVPLQITFTDTSTNTPTSWLWSFGDNTISNLQNPTHIFANSGSYSVSLTATNDGGSNRVVKQITVSPKSNFQAAFRADKRVGRAPLTVNFYDSTSGGPIQWLWTISDGTTYNTRLLKKTFKHRGSYSVTLWVRNSKGQTSSVTKQDYIVVQ